jgi:hypothetical protein
VLTPFLLLGRGYKLAEVDRDVKFYNNSVDKVILEVKKRDSFHWAATIVAGVLFEPLE